MIYEENILIQAGLSEEQAIVYQSLLEKGAQKATPLSQWVGLKRSTVYKVLEQLISLGLVEKKGGQGSVTVFTPNHPSALFNIIERKEKELIYAKETVQNSLGGLISKYNLLAGKPSIQFFEGLQAVKKITSDFPQKDTEIRQIIDIGKALEYFSKETLEYLEERKKKKIYKRMLVPQNQKNIHYTQQTQDFTAYNILPHVTNLDISLQIYDDKLTLLKLKQNNIIGIIIEDLEISGAMKQIFDSLWHSDSDK